jgi:hypothetical protein
VQSSYIPWKGYFDLIGAVDEFILYDSVQYTRRDWRNRNRIKTPHGLLWLSVPVRTRGRYHQAIAETEISDPGWAARHWRTLRHHYAAADGFAAWAPRLERLYAECAADVLLSAVNERCIRALCGMLEIRTPIARCTDYEAPDGGDATDRLLALCRAAGADEYLSGPAARGYLDVERFARAGIAVRWADYGGYAEYPQRFGPFEHRVSVVDLLLNTGRDAARYLKAGA